MRGSIKKRGSTYSIRLDLGPDPVTGKKRRQKRLSGFKTRKEAEAALAKTITEANTGTFCDPGKTTIGDLLDRFLKRGKDRWAPKTYDGYQIIVRKHLKPILGNHKLVNFTPAILEDCYDKLLKKGLSPTTVLHCHRLFHTTLDYACKQQLIFRNVADAVEPPKMTKKAPNVMTEDQVSILLKAFAGTSLYTPVLLSLATGMRLGEILGLRWKDVDLNQGTLQVVQVYQRVLGGRLLFREPKTPGSRRLVPIPPSVAEELTRQEVKQKKWRLKSGSAWHDSGLVCTMEDGSPIDPAYLSRVFRLRTKEAGLDLRFHDLLRHSQATLLLKWGIHPRIVAERLGHSTTRLTLDTYSHVVPTMQSEAVKFLEERLFQRKDVTTS